MRRIVHVNEPSPLVPGEEGYWHGRSNDSWEALQALSLTEEERQWADKLPPIRSIPLSRKRREALIRAGLLAVKGPRHVAILAPSFPSSWELRDAVIAILNIMEHDPEDIRRLHGWDERTFRRFTVARHLGVDAYVAAASEDKYRSSRRQSARAALAPRNDWMDDSFILMLRDKSKVRKR